MLRSRPIAALVVAELVPMALLFLAATAGGEAALGELREEAA